jgi:dTDP-4-dehydrorhamnose reductase
VSTANKSMILITGANGLLGQKLCRDFSASHEVTACDLHPQSFAPISGVTYRPLDVTNQPETRWYIQNTKTQAIINAAAYTDVDGCETHKKEAWVVNVGAVENLARICREREIKLIQLSTDYVFDGENGPYSEEDHPQPVSFYGETKLESEKLTAQSGIDFLIVRTNVLYGSGYKVRQNFLLWLLDKLSQDEKIKIVTDQFNNPTLADNLSECIQEMVEKKLSGIYHVGGAEYLSRYDFAIKAALKFDFDPALISSTQTEFLEQKAARPHWGGLKTDKVRKVLRTKLLDVEEGLEQVKKGMEYRV